MPCFITNFIQLHVHTRYQVGRIYLSHFIALHIQCIILNFYFIAYRPTVPDSECGKPLTFHRQGHFFDRSFHRHVLLYIMYLSHLIDRVNQCKTIGPKLRYIKYVSLYVHFSSRAQFIIHDFCSVVSCYQA